MRLDFQCNPCGEIYTLMEFLKIFCYFPISFLQHQCCLNNVLVFMYHPFIVTPCILYIRNFYTEEQWAVSFPFRPMVLVITGLQTHNLRSGCFICQAQTEHLRNLYLDFRAFTVKHEFIFSLQGDSNVKIWRLTVPVKTDLYINFVLKPWHTKSTQNRSKWLDVAETSNRHCFFQCPVTGPCSLSWVCQS